MRKIFETGVIFSDISSTFGEFVDRFWKQERIFGIYLMDIEVILSPFHIKVGIVFKNYSFKLFKSNKKIVSQK